MDGKKNEAQASKPPVPASASATTHLVAPQVDAALAHVGSCQQVLGGPQAEAGDRRAELHHLQHMRACRKREGAGWTKKAVGRAAG